MITGGPRTLHAPAGRPALLALAEEIETAKAGDPLAPITVLVPSAAAGLSLRRLLGSGAISAGSGRRGLLNVRFLPVARVTELIGSPSLAAEGRRLLTGAARAEAIRVSLEEAPGAFASVADHPSTERVLEQTFADLRAATPETLGRLAAQSPRAADVVRLFLAARDRLARRWYDEHDQFLRALEVIAGNHLDHGSLADLGVVVVYAARPLDREARALAAALGPRAVVLEARTDAAPVGTHILSTSDGDDEVRAIAREIVSLARQGVPLHRIAVAHPGAGYPRLLHQCLDAAGIPHNGPGIRTLAATVPGTTLLGALALPDHGFRRDAVMAWLASAPVLEPATGRPVPGAQWDALSRRAGVVSGAKHWEDRLERLRVDLVDRSRVAAAEGDDSRAERAGRSIEQVARLRTFVADLAQELAVTDRRPWADHARWARRLLDRHLGSAHQRRAWPDRDQAAWDQVQGALDGLAGLDELGPPPDLATFRRAVERDLSRPAERVGSFGDGVLIAAIPALRGLDLDAVIVAGMAEGLWPGKAHDHPLLPDRERVAAGQELVRPDAMTEQRDALHQALAAASGHRILSVPRADLATGRELLPSRWLLDTASALAGRRVSGGQLEALASNPAVTVVGSFVAGISGSTPASLFDHDLGRLQHWWASGGSPADHPLARDRPRLGAGWAAMSARSKGGFSAHEGLVDPTAVPALDPDRPLSPTALETYAECPRRYFLGKVLHVTGADRPEDIDQISPAERGTLVHAILEDYVTEVIDGADRLLPRLLEIASHHFAEVEGRGLTGRPLRWQYDQQIIERELAWFHRVDDLQPIATELAFGMAGETPVSIDLPSGRRLAFKGKADRVDVDPANGDLVVTDYKTGGSYAFKDLAETWIARGTKLQLPTYGLAASLRYGTPGQTVRTRYWFTSERGRFEEIGYYLDQEKLDRFTSALDVIVAGITGGRFPARPGPVRNWPDNGSFENCVYCDFHQVCPTDRGRAWARVRLDPSLDDYRNLAEPDPAAAQP